MILGTLKYLNYKYKLLLYNFAENDKSDFASAFTKVWFYCNLIITTQRSSTQAALNYKAEKEHARNSFGLVPQGHCERTPLILEKTTSSVLFVLL